jgi:hypothetical protein
VLRVGDATPEKLAELIVNHGHVAMLSAEGGGITTATGRRYSDSTFFEVLLMGHAGDALAVDRKSAEPLRTDRALMTIAVTAQPSFVEEMASDSAVRSRGLLARFLILQPPDLVGGRPFEADDIPDKVADKWAGRIGEVARLSYAQGPQTLPFTSQAMAALGEFHDRLERRAGPSGDLAPARDWVGKAVGGAARIAVLLSAVDDREGRDATVVEAGYAQAGVAIMGCLVEHFLAILDGAAVSPRMRDARDLWGRIQRGDPATGGLPERVSVRDLRRWIPKLCRDDGDPRLRAALSVLTDHGYVRGLPPPGGRGRPSEAYEIRPELHSESGAKNATNPGADE